MAVTFAFRRRTLNRIFFLAIASLLVHVTFFRSQHPKVFNNNNSQSHQIQGHNFIERATLPDKSLNVQRHPFLQARMGRDEREDLFSNLVRTGVRDYWERFQRP